MKKNIAVINTKGGVGKSTLSYNLLPYLLRGKEFQIIEIDDNNDTSSSFVSSELLAGKIVSCDISQGTMKLEELVIDNMLDDKKVTIIDGGGGNDSKLIISALIKEDLAKDTLFIIPYFPDFSQLKNLFETVELVKNYDYMVVLNNFVKGSDDEKFKDGNEDFEIPNISEIFKKNFAIVPKSNLFSYSSSILKQSIFDFAKIAFDYDRKQILEYAKDVTGGDKDKITQIYRDWKNSDNAKDYLQSVEIDEFKRRVLKWEPKMK